MHLNTPVPQTEDKLWRAYKTLFSGGVAGAVSRTAVAPFERIKILFQVRIPAPYYWLLSVYGDLDVTTNGRWEIQFFSPTRTQVICRLLMDDAIFRLKETLPNINRLHKRCGWLAKKKVCAAISRATASIVCAYFLIRHCNSYHMKLTNEYVSTCNYFGPFFANSLRHFIREISFT